MFFISVAYLYDNVLIDLDCASVVNLFVACWFLNSINLEGYNFCLDENELWELKFVRICG